MPSLIISDLHGNLEALEAVLADAEGRYEGIFCLGDLVGYGADPNAIVERVRSSVTAVIRGNHDRACSGSESLEDFNPVARTSAYWTRRILSPENREYLERLVQGPLRVKCVGREFDLAHGSPLDEDQYLVTLDDVRDMPEKLDAQLTFIGHTHIQGGFIMARKLVGYLYSTSTLQLEPNYRYLVNPGSVGQPRDGDPRAAYALYSPEEKIVEFRRVMYDIEKAAEKILDAGLPPLLAARLFQGM